MKIKDIDLTREILVVAEVGNNHEGSYALAEKLIGLAAEAGARAVKFQTFRTKNFIASCEKERIRQLKKYELSYAQFEKLKKVADREGIMFLSTPFDIDSAMFLEPLVPAFKVSSGDNNFLPMIEYIAMTGKPVVLSAGMAGFEEIAVTKEFIFDIWRKKSVEPDRLAILHCVSNYPTKPYDANLSFMNELKDLDVTVGYSDHTMGIEAALLSVAMGARIIEKHFTIDKKYSDFRDHSISADPKELKRLVRKIKHVEAILGGTKKHLLRCEESVAERARRSIAAKLDMRAGTKIQIDGLTWLRPALGLSVGEEWKVLGRVLKKGKKAGDLIELADLIDEQ